MARVAMKLGDGWRAVSRAAALVWVAGVLAACGGSDAPPPPPPSEGQATIGAAGGTVKGPDGVQVGIPDGVLAQDTTVRVARDGTGAPAVAGLRLLTPVYQITPHGAQFDAPARIVIPFDPAQLRSGTAPVIVRAQPGDTTWEVLKTDVDGGVAAADSFGFSYYAVGECFISRDITVPGPDPIASCPSGHALSLRLLDNNAVQLPQLRNFNGTLKPMATIDKPTTFNVNLGWSRPTGTTRTDTLRLRVTSGVPGVLVRDIPVDVDVYSLTVFNVTIDPSQIPGASTPGGKLVRIWATVSYEFDAFYPGCVCFRPTSWTYTADLLVRVVYTGAQPSITEQPANQSVTAGQIALFRVSVSASNPSFQWQRGEPNSTTFADIAGATSGLYMTPATTLSDSGARYRARVCTSGGAPTVTACIVSDAAVLTVVPAAVAPVFTQQPQSISAVEGQTASFTAVANGTPAPQVMWFRVGSPDVAVGTPCAGSGSSTNCTYTTPPLTQGDSGTQFRAHAENGAGDSFSQVATLTVTQAPVAPSIPSAEPADVSVTVGQSATFSVNATGTAPLSYQWQRDGTAIPSANGPSYTLANAQLTDNGARFSVVVDNGVAQVQSREALLTVTSPPPPPPSAGICTSASPAGWCWVQPGPHSNDLSALAFDGATIRAIGRRTSMQSGDAGATWQTVFNGIDVEWGDVASPAPGVLVAAATASYSGAGLDLGLHRSADGGQTWTPVLAQAASSIAFESATTGIAVGTGIWRTSDGGVSWTEVQAPGPTMALSRVVSPAPGVYLAIGSAPALIMRSVDGGFTWTQPAPGTSDALLDISFGTASVGVIATNSSVLRTTDGGASWSAPIAVGTSIFDHVAFADASTVIAMSAVGEISRSGDAGLTWSAASGSPLSGAQNIARMKFLGATDGYAVGFFGQVWRTTDAGQNWSLAAGGSNLERFDSIKFRGGEGLAAQLNDVLRTQDGGASWQSLGVVGANDIALVDASVRVAVGIGIRRSGDRGDNWTLVHTLAGGQFLRAVDFVPSTGAVTTGVAVGSNGSNGLMLRTTEGGLIWSPVTIGTVPPLTAVAFSAGNPGLGLAGGANRALLRTTDSGATWSAVTPSALGTTETIQAIRFTSTGVFIAADNGLYRSTDGGFNWTRVYDSTGRGSMLDLTFLNATEAVAVGVSGTIVRSTDAGATWTAVGVPVTVTLSGVAFTGNGSEVVAVGDGGTILRNTQGGAP